MTQVSNNIDERSQYLLKVLVDRYIKEGQPVGSKTLAEETGLGLSSATIRNVLADLEEHGFLHSPHTSAGRIPTAKGYRFFIDSLLTVQPLDDNAIQQFQQQLTPDLNIPALVTSTSNLLSELTRLTGLVMLPQREQVLLRHVEFLSLTQNRVLVILVFNNQEVENRIIYTDRPYSPNELQQAANYLNATYTGYDISQVKQELISALQQDRDHANTLMQTTIDIAAKALDEPKYDKDYVLTGQNHLFNLPNQTGVTRLKELFEAFTQKRDILHLLDQCLNTKGIQIFIGEESGYALFDECSLVTAPYSVNNKTVGVLGVIGPTRMPYDKIIPIVDVTAKLLSSALNQAV